MDTQFLINAGFGLAMFFGGFILRAVWGEIKALQNAQALLQASLSELRASISAQYVRRDDFRDHAQRVEAMLDRIDAKLDEKADKP